MALTVVSSGNTIHASDITQFINLFTGVMADQLITFINMHTQKSKGATPAAPSQAIAAGGSVDVGAHSYAVSFVGQTGEETLAGTTVVATTTGGNQTVNLTSIPTGPTGTTARNIYRSKVGTTSPLFLVHTISDNVTTTYSDTVADSTLVTQSPSHPTFGASSRWQDSTGVTKAQIYGDGAVYFDAGSITSDGAGTLTVTGQFVANVPSTGQGLAITYASAPAGTVRAFGANVSGDSTSRVAGYIRSDGYGQLRVGNSTNTWNLYGQSDGIHFDTNLFERTGGVDYNIPYISPTGASTAGRRIFTGTTTPSSPSEGDIWIQA